MKTKHKLLRQLGGCLPLATGFQLAGQSRHFRYLARPGTDFVFERYLGHLKVVVDTAYPIELEMLTGRYDRDTSDLIQALFQEDWTGVDVGANVGALTLLMADLAPKGQVVAIEPGPVLNTRLHRNVAANQTLGCKVQIVAAGVSDAPGQLFWNEDPQNRGNAGLLDSQGTAVVVKTLDQIVQELALPRMDFVKIDVEGMEYEVIKGGLASISTMRPLLYYETLDAFRAVRGFDIYSKAHELLAGIGYRHFAVMPRARLVAVQSLQQLQSKNVLAVPEERAHALQALL